MSQGQRFSFLGIAVLIAVVAVFVLGTSGGDEGDEQTSTGGQTTAEQTATPSATTASEEAEPVETETPTTTPTPKPVPVLSPENPKELEVDEGERIRFRVRSETADHVHVHGYNLLKDIPAGGSVTFAFKAGITGIFEIELEDSHVPVGSLRVNP